MINKIVVFTGSRRDFQKLLSQKISNDEETVTFMESIQHYNARLRPNESGVRESVLSSRIEADNLVVQSDDFGSVLEHVLANFNNIISVNYDVGTLYINNPPKRVLRSLEAANPDSMEYCYSKYRKVNQRILKKVFTRLETEILGQELCKKQIISGIYRLRCMTAKQPAVLVLYGPSGVGKTETAKCISKTLGGELLRIQFSMMQSNEAYNYVFGGEHSRSSFARDMIGRESNVILIDEFDKVSPTFYNAFYELFDEGRFVDANYDVELHDAIFLCTTNFKNEEEIKKQLGPAMFSRIGCCIEYTDLSAEQKCQIIDKWYAEVMKKLSTNERNTIEKTDILAWFKKNADRYDNIRILKTKLENAIFDELAQEFVIQA